MNEELISQVIQLGFDEEKVKRVFTEHRERIRSVDDLAWLVSEEEQIEKNEAAALEILSLEPQSFNLIEEEQHPAPPPSKRQERSSDLNEQLQCIRKELYYKWKHKNDFPTSAATTTTTTTQKLSPSINDQLREFKSKQKQKWLENRNEKKRIWTLSDLSKLETTTTTTTTTTMNGNKTMIEIGKRALQLTNEFRAKEGRSALEWNQSLCEIGFVHSKNMGDKKVKFGHDGFNERMKQFPGFVRSAGENVAMNKGFSDVAKIAVDGWIDSPGHRKNLLGHFNYCGIGVYQSSAGSWYLTQLLSLHG